MEIRLNGRHAPYQHAIIEIVFLLYEEKNNIVCTIVVVEGIV